MGHQPDDLDVAQHSTDLVMQTQLLLRPETLHAVKRRVHMVGQAQGLLPAGVVTALWPRGPYARQAWLRSLGWPAAILPQGSTGDPGHDSVLIDLLDPHAS